MARIDTMMKRFLLLSAGAAILAVAPACGTDTDVPAAEASSSPNDDASGHFEREFTQNLGLRASLSSTVLLQLESAAAPQTDDTGVAGTDVVPYRVQYEETVNVCLRDVETSVQEVVFRNDRDDVVLRVAHGSDCASAVLPAGDYLVSIARSVTGPSAANPIAEVFLHPLSADAPPELHAGFGVQCSEQERNTDPTSVPADQSWYVTSSAGVVHGDQDAQQATLVEIKPLGADANPGDRNDALKAEAVYGGTRFRSAQSNNTITGGGRGETRGDILFFEPFLVDERVSEWNLIRKGPYTFEPTSPTSWYGPSFGWIAEGDFLYWDPSPPRLTLTFGMRFVPNAATIGALRTGEVALFEQCNYGGRAVVVNTSNAFPPNLRAAAAYLGGAAKSMKLSCDAALQAYPAENHGGRGKLLAQSIPCSDSLGSQVVSASVRNVRELLIETRSCAYCDLHGVDVSQTKLPGIDLDTCNLAGVNFTGTDLTDSFILFSSDLSDANFTDAVLTRSNIAGSTGRPTPARRASFVHATLTDARFNIMDLTEAKFDRADLRGARLLSSNFDRASFDRTSFVGVNEITDCAITNTELTSALWDNPRFNLLPGQSLPADPCTQPRNDAVALTKLAGTRFRFGQIPVAAWKYIDFTDARMHTDGLSVDARDLARQNLCGTKLGGLQFVRFKLGEAKLNNADLARTTFRNTDLRFADFTGALLNGASVTYSDTTGAKMDNVIADAGTSVTTFSGTRFAPQTMLNGRFSRALFVKAAVVFPAARTGSTFAAAKFSDVNFTDADLTGLNMTGADFTNATFNGATLKDTKFGRNSTFRDATFCGAKVEDADFSGAALEGALFPTSDTVVANLLPGGATVACPRVVLGTKPSLDVAVITIDAATCPNGDTVPKGGSCTLAEFARSTPQPIVRCLLTKISDGAGLACSACANDCDCDSHLCTALTCSPCVDK